MAGGWARDGAVNEQIEASISDELARMRAQQAVPRGPARSDCADCGEPIPAARQAALPGVTLCISCQQEQDRTVRHRGGINRRASKDSQLK